MARTTLEFVIDSKGNLRAFSEAGNEIEGVGKGAKDASKGMSALTKAAGMVAGALAAVKSAQAAVDFVKMGANVQATAQRFEAFAGGADAASEHLEAFQRASDGTVTKMEAMSGASRMLQMGLVDNAAEMEVMAAIAVKLGDQTMDTGSRVADFSALLANTSIPRLDNFGISSGRVRTRIKELQAATADLSREEAFKIAVLEEGRKSLDILGDTSENTATKIAKVESAVADAKQGIALLTVEMLAGAKGADELAARIRGLPDTIHHVTIMSRAHSAATKEVGTAYQNAAEWNEAYQRHLKRLVAAETDFQVANEQTRYAHYRSTEAVEVHSGAYYAYLQQLHEGEMPVTEASLAQSQYAQAMTESYGALDQMVISGPAWREEMALQAQAAEAARLQTVTLAASLKDASKAQVGAAAVGELTRLWEEAGTDPDRQREIAQAISETQITFGLADEASVQLAERMMNLVTQFDEGRIAASDFDDQLDMLYKITEAERLQVELFGDTLANLKSPEPIMIDVFYNYHGGGPSAGMPAMGGGASNTDNSVSNTTNYNVYNNTPASTQPDYYGAASLVR